MSYTTYDWPTDLHEENRALRSALVNAEAEARVATRHEEDAKGRLQEMHLQYDELRRERDALRLALEPFVEQDADEIEGAVELGCVSDFVAWYRERQADAEEALASL